MGNIRLSYFKNANGSTEVLEENNYYPFGLKHEGYNSLIGNLSYNYGFGSKELQKETGWNDFGARMYMSDIGRWGVVDPMAEAEASWTPYRYGFNNPILFTDPTGMIELTDIDRMWNTGGSYNYSNGNLNYLGGGNLGGNYFVDDRFKDDYYTPPADYLEFDIPQLTINVPKSYKGNSALMRLSMGMEIPNHLSTYIGRQVPDYDPLAWVKNDGPVKMIGGFGDPAGIFDVGGQIMSTWEPENRYLAMGVGVLAAFALKKPQLALAEERAGAYSVYQGFENGIVKYVGITKRTPSVRWAEHVAEGGPKANLFFETQVTGLTRTQARVWEQNIINQHGLSNLYNKINSIAPKNGQGMV